MKNPPKDISAAAAAWWRDLLNEYCIDDSAGLLLLETACRAFDRMAEARAHIKKKGMVVADRFGQPRQNPMLAVERDARQSLLAALKQLKLDIEPPNPKGYPLRNW